MLPLVISGGILIALAFLVDTLSGNGGAGAEYGSKAPLELLQQLVVLDLLVHCLVDF